MPGRLAWWRPTTPAKPRRTVGLTAFEGLITLGLLDWLGRTLPPNTPAAGALRAAAGRRTRLWLGVWATVLALAGGFVGLWFYRRKVRRDLAWAESLAREADRLD